MNIATALTPENVPLNLQSAVATATQKSPKNTTILSFVRRNY